MTKQPMHLLLIFMVLAATLSLLFLQIHSLIGLREDLKTARQFEIQSLVDSAHGLIQNQYALFEQGLISEDQAQKSALSLIEKMKYRNGEYFYILNSKAVTLAHGGNAATRGLDVSDYTTENGDRVFQRMADLSQVENGADFFYYNWTRAATSEAIRKMTYARAFTPWQWIVATGVYIDDIEATIKDKSITKLTWTFVLVLILITTLIILAKNILFKWEQKLQQLERSEAGYRTLFEKSEDPMFIIVADMLVECNDAAAHLFGYKDHHELLLIHPSQITPRYQPCGQRTRYLTNQFIQEAYEKGYCRFEARHLKKDGTEFPAEVTLTCLTYQDETALYAILRDMSDFHETLSALEGEKQKAECALKAKSTFMATMTHEIRTPLNAILGLTDILLKEANLTDDLKKDVMAMETAGQSLFSLVNNVLDMTSLENGQLVLNPRPFNPEPLLHTTLCIFEKEARTKGITLDFQYEGPPGLLYLGDPDRLRQIVMNLLGNAFKFTSKGSICLRTRPLRKNGQDGLALELSDSGIGIKASERAKIFERYHQANTAHNRQYGGAGLGLSICHALIKAMGGDIEVESQEGVGSTFKVFLPFARAPEKSHVPEMEVPQIRLSQKQALKVLLAEDNLINQKVAQKFLSNLGHNVSVANNGQEAVDAIHQDQFDVIFMDMQMPVVDGLEATRHIRTLKERDHKDIYIIALTANADNEFKEACFEAGMNDFMTKPFKQNDLERHLDRFLKGKGC